MQSLIKTSICLVSLSFASAQAQLPTSLHNSVALEAGSLNGTKPVIPDIAPLASRYGISRQSLPANRIAAVSVEDGSGVCSSRRMVCIAVGALVGGLAGGLVGTMFEPKPEYGPTHSGYSFFGEYYSWQPCVAKCDPGNAVLYSAIGGSIIGGAGGWLLGRR